MENIEKSLEIIPIEDAEGIKGVARLAGEIWREYYTSLIGGEQVEYMLKNLQSEEAIRSAIDEGSRYYTAVYDGEPVGYMATFDRGAEKVMFLSKLYIKKEYRGRGFARVLLNHCVRRANEASFKQIYLTVNKGNLNAIAAYEKMGFVRREQVKADIGGGFYMDDYIMRLYL